MSRTRQKHKRTTSPFRQGGPKPPPAQRTHRGSSKAEKEKDRERGGHHLARGTGAGPGPAMSVPSTASMRRWSRSPDGPEGSAARRARANERRQQTSSCASGWGAPAGGVRQRGGEGRGAGLRRQRGRERGYGKGLPSCCYCYCATAPAAAPAATAKAIGYRQVVAGGGGSRVATTSLRSGSNPSARTARRSSFSYLYT